MPAQILEVYTDCPMNGLNVYYTSDLSEGCPGDNKRILTQAGDNLYGNGDGYSVYLKECLGNYYCPSRTIDWGYDD